MARPVFWRLRSYIRICALLSLVGCFLATEGLPQQLTSDWTGTRKLNAKASKQGAVHGSDLLEIKQSGTHLKVRHRGPSWDRINSYVIDGKEHLANFASDGTTTAKTYWDGDTLVIETHNHDNNRGFLTDTFFKFRYTLSADKKTLLVAVQGMRLPFEGPAAELVYEKATTSLSTDSAKPRSP